jgi:hypothetical protein
MSDFEVVGIPEQTTKARSYDEAWKAILDNIGKALKFSALTDVEFESLYTALRYRGKKSGLRMRRRSLPDGNYLWLEKK